MSRKYRCAVYTRKSTEDGLEQDFNSLDAQRESCEAFIKSQQHEGWKLLADKYDDGGISGGTMERPALQRLLDEVKAGRVDIIVVYKVDRLTRALSDFAKMVDLFDEHEVSFVSVTQQFNTTTSMGRLTLNVLLSFAQFEREVTAERIRDKIAASKKKGMWMGGLVPLGYDAIDKKLIVNQAEAKTVRTLFDLYLETGNVRRVKEEADKRGLKSKIRKLKGGCQIGGCSFSRGQLYCLLKNRTYIGEVTHKGQSYEGMHDAIIERETWDAVQVRLKQNASNRKGGTNAKSPSLLTGLIKDEAGNLLTPTHASKQGRRYHYYVSSPDQGGRPIADWRLPAGEVDNTVLTGIESLLIDRLRLTRDLALPDVHPDAIEALFAQAQELSEKLSEGDKSTKRKLLLRIVESVQVRLDRIRIKLHGSDLLHVLELDDLGDEATKILTIDLPVKLRRRGVEKKIVITDGNRKSAMPDVNLINTLAQGRLWFEQLKSGEFRTAKEIAAKNNTDFANVTRTMQLAFLAPDIVDAILEGRQPTDLTAFSLKRMKNLPLSWAEQQKTLGFAS